MGQGLKTQRGGTQIEKLLWTNPNPDVDKSGYAIDTIIDIREFKKIKFIEKSGKETIFDVDEINSNRWNTLTYLNGNQIIVRCFVFMSYNSSDYNYTNIYVYPPYAIGGTQITTPLCQPLKVYGIK